MGTGLSTQKYLPPGLRAQAMSWPLWRTGTRSFDRVTGIARIRAALEHLTVTPLGSYWVDPRYGSLWQMLRTQGMSLDDGDSAGGGLQQVVLSHYEQQVAIYIPSVALHGVTPQVLPDNGGLRVNIIWTLVSSGGQGAQSALPESAGNSTSPLSVIVA